MTGKPTPPAWVTKRDGQVAPFEPDRIARALFLATETLGQPDSFMARELADSAVHFLSQDADSAIPTTRQIAEIVAKVVRELGQPTLARTYLDLVEKHSGQLRAAAAQKPSADPALDVWQLSRDPRTRASQASRSLLTDWSLREAYPREIAAAHHEGLITLGGLEAPFELAACTLEKPGQLPLIESFETCRGLASGRVALDGPEFFLIHQDEATATRYLRELLLGVRCTGLDAVVNLNTIDRPGWAENLVEGPLFGSSACVQAGRLPELLETLIVGLLAGEGCALNWHLSERDFEESERPRLIRLVQRALEGKPIGFVFDRPRAPIFLDEGIERRNPAVLLDVGLELPRLARMIDMDESHVRAERFLHKLGSVVRLALSAGVQRRQFLRQHRPGWPAFLLDRARLLLAPRGLETVARDLFGHALAEGGPGLEFGRHVVERIVDVMTQDGQAVSLECCLGQARPGDAIEPAGVTPWDEKPSPRQQLRAAGRLHAGLRVGSASLLMDAETADADQLAKLLHTAWKETDIGRLELVAASQPTQMIAPW